MYTDAVHLDDRGQAALADRLEPVAAARLRTVARGRASSPLKDARCARIRDFGLRVAASVPLGSIVSVNDGQLRASAGAVHLISDSRPYAYSAYVAIGGVTTHSGEGVLRVTVHGVLGAVGIVRLPTLDAKTFLDEQVVERSRGPLSLDSYVPDGRALGVLLVRNLRLDGASEIVVDAVQWLEP